MDNKICTYCGQPATDREHVVPVSYTSPARNFLPGTTIPSCRECNNLLGSHIFNRFDSRCAFLLKTLYKKYKKLLKSPHWSQEDLRELGSKLRQAIERSELEKQQVRIRIEYLRNVLKRLELLDSTV